MSNEIDGRIYHTRKSQRLSGYDYGSSGAYSITACTRRREPFFESPALQTILEEQWEALPKHFPGITTDTLVIMPDHIHCLVWIDANVEGASTVSNIIGGYKSLVSVAWLRYMKKTGIHSTSQIWQRSFHDHIIRNEHDLKEKQTYALNNPVVRELKNVDKQYKGLR